MDSDVQLISAFNYLYHSNVNGLLYFTGNVEITWLLFIFCRPYSSLSDRLQRKEKADPYILIQNDLKDVNDAIMKV